MKTLKNLLISLTMVMGGGIANSLEYTTLVHETTYFDTQNLITTCQYIVALCTLYNSLSKTHNRSDLPRNEYKREFRNLFICNSILLALETLKAASPQYNPLKSLRLVLSMMAFNADFITNVRCLRNPR